MTMTGKRPAGEPCLEPLHSGGAAFVGDPVPAQSFKIRRRHGVILPAMSAEQALAFVVFASVAAITPGPSNVMLTVTGALVGVARGIPCLLGVASGMALMMFVVAFGLGAIVVAHPLLLMAAKWSGAAFLLWLAWKIANAPHGTSPGQGQDAIGFAGAFAFQWLNPKSWLVSISASGTYLRPDAPALVQAGWIAGLFFLVAIACGFAWLAFGTAMRSLLGSPRLQKAFNWGMAALLAASVLLFVW
jgi:threonine/homoserine/homoserine lactone efflux protein